MVNPARAKLSTEIRLFYARIAEQFLSCVRVITIAVIRSRV